jgi:5-hydroxyisourate hydrolase
MSSITTHILDAVTGRPAAEVTIQLEKLESDAWLTIATGATDADGRCRELCPNTGEGVYRLNFAVGSYFARSGRSSLYPEVVIHFRVDGAHPYHIPLLLSDNSYTTYRGS